MKRKVLPARRRGVSLGPRGAGILIAALAAAALPAFPASAAATTVTFTTPGTHELVIPAGVTSVSVDMFGAAGGANSNGTPGGLGAEAHASTLAVTPGETLTVVVGGVGGTGIETIGSPTTCEPGAGGYNGGGAAGACTESAAAGGGGGASEVKRGATALVVAGGGGGTGANGAGGSGGAGGQSGVDGADDTTGFGGRGGGGATPTAPGAGGAGQGGGAAGLDGSAGQGGEGGLFAFGGSGGGGGGGVFGGGGGGASQNYAGGGGGGGSSMGPAGTVFTTGADAANSGDGKVAVSYTSSPSLAVTASAGITLGGQIHATATLSDGFEPTGTISFAAYGPNDSTCSGTPAFTSSVGVSSGNGSYESAVFTPTQAATYRWTAAYSGDADNEAATTSCGDAGSVVTVAEATPQPQPTPTPEPTPAPTVRVRYSPNHPHEPNPAGGARYTFRFTADVPGAVFYCRMDKQPFKRCGSPKVYRHLRRGRHVFRVKAVDAEGRESAISKVTFQAGRRRG